MGMLEIILSGHWHYKKGSPLLNYHQHFLRIILAMSSSSSSFVASTAEKQRVEERMAEANRADSRRRMRTATIWEKNKDNTTVQAFVVDSFAGTVEAFQLPCADDIAKNVEIYRRLRITPALRPLVDTEPDVNTFGDGITVYSWDTSGRWSGPGFSVEPGVCQQRLAAAAEQGIRQVFPDLLFGVGVFTKCFRMVPPGLEISLNLSEAEMPSIVFRSPDEVARMAPPRE